MLQREPHSEDTTHGLRDDVARSWRKPLHEPAEQIVQRVDARVGREAAEARPAEEMDGTEIRGRSATGRQNEALPPAPGRKTRGVIASLPSPRSNGVCTAYFDSLDRSIMLVHSQ
jgi:hypothetical protein